jgi:hypothetical protein
MKALKLNHNLSSSKMAETLQAALAVLLDLQQQQQVVNATMKVLVCI